MSSGEVLVVDDNADILEALQMAIEIEGLKVATASNGKEALEILEKGKRPDLILLDLMMPIMDGWTFAEQFGKKKEYSDIPIVIISAFADQNQFPEIAVEALTKPLNFSNLIKTVKKYCGNDSKI